MPAVFTTKYHLYHGSKCCSTPSCHEPAKVTAEIRGRYVLICRTHWDDVVESDKRFPAFDTIHPENGAAYNDR